MQIYFFKKNNLESLFNHIERIVHLNSNIKAQIRSISKVKILEKGTILIKQNQANVTSTYFVVDGCARSYYTDDNAKEHTVQFSVKDNWISDYMSLYTDERASLTLECISDVTLIEASIFNIEEIFKKFPQLETYHRNNLQINLVKLNRRILNLLHLTAPERYKLFLEYYKGVDQFALNLHIASYLGITQQSLSRIRGNKI